MVSFSALRIAWAFSLTIVVIEIIILLVIVELVGYKNYDDKELTGNGLNFYEELLDLTDE